MRALFVSCALFAVLAGPLSADAPPARFLKIDIVSKSGIGHVKSEGGPTEVHMRMPINLAKGVLDMASEGSFKVNGKTHREMKAEQLLKLIETAKPGELLLEITTDKGDLVKVVIE